jgi:RNA polymerase sigma-70 factor (ECF subfamily)
MGAKPAWDVRMIRPEREAVSTAPIDLDHLDDGALVSAFRAGHREAFDTIVVRHRRNVYQLCYRFVGNHEDAADLAQDVFVRAFKGLSRFKGDAALGTWLYRIAVNVCLKRLASKRPTAEPIDTARRLDDGAAGPMELAERAERSRVLRAAIARLPPRQRATVILRVYHDLSHEEIARVLDSSVGAVKANFFHAIGNLKRLVTR